MEQPFSNKMALEVHLTLFLILLRLTFVTEDDKIPFKSTARDNCKFVILSKVFVRAKLHIVKFKVRSYFHRYGKYKCSKRMKRQRCNCLCFILLLLCGDIESNPGPINVCPICQNKVLDHHHAVLCDGCNCWYHRQCVNMTKKVYQNLARMSSFAWQCNNCIRSDTITVNTYRKRKQMSPLSKLQFYVPESKKQNVLQEHSYAVHQPEMTSTNQMESNCIETMQNDSIETIQNNSNQLDMAIDFEMVC